VFLPKPKLQRHHRFRTYYPSGTKNHSESECKSLWFLKAPIVRTMQHSVFTACAYGPRSSCTCNQNMTPCQRVLGAFALCCVNSTTTVQFFINSGAVLAAASHTSGQPLATFSSHNSRIQADPQASSSKESASQPAASQPARSQPGSRTGGRQHGLLRLLPLIRPHEAAVAPGDWWLPS
jgi:hypothetical protein